MNTGFRLDTLDHRTVSAAGQIHTAHVLANTQDRAPRVASVRPGADLSNGCPDRTTADKVRAARAHQCADIERRLRATLVESALTTLVEHAPAI